jgi:DNA invertase Pin-like site-specific DNA recombinase
MTHYRGPGKGGTLKATEQPIDTSTAAGKCFLDKLGVFVEFETNLRRERQLEGIVKAKAAGVYKGRPASIDAARVWEMKAEVWVPPRSPVRQACRRARTNQGQAHRVRKMHYVNLTTGRVLGDSVIR